MTVISAADVDSVVMLDAASTTVAPSAFRMVTLIVTCLSQFATNRPVLARARGDYCKTPVRSQWGVRPNALRRAFGLPANPLSV